MSSDQRAKAFSERLPRLLKVAGFGRKFYGMVWERVYPRAELQEYTAKIAENIANGQGVILSGSVGVGKTSIMALIAEEALRVGRWQHSHAHGVVLQTYYHPRFRVRYVTASQLFALMFEREAGLIENFRDCDLLMIDDLGWEYPADFPLSKFRDLINHRTAHMLATCIATNLNREMLVEDTNSEFAQKYWQIVDRLRDRELFTFIEINEESQRPTNRPRG
ncbi:MAG: hypothetical protein ACE5FM_02445 [Methyloligellaceae bacterium]